MLLVLEHLLRQVGSPLVDIEVTAETPTQDGAAVQTEVSQRRLHS